MSDSPVRICVAYHSGFGHTARMAQAVHEGAAAVSGVSSALIQVGSMTDADWLGLDAADGIVFGSPTYMGSASPEFHAFSHASSTRWGRQQWKDKVAAGFTTSGAMSGDKLNTLQYFTVLAAQHGMHWVNIDLLPGGTERDLNRLGGWLGALAHCPGDHEPSAMNQADLATARHLGTRVAHVAAHLRRPVDA